MFPHPITHLAFEVTERTFFAASSDEFGSLYQVKLFRRRDDESRRIDAVGGGGMTEAIRVDTDPKRTIVVG